MMDRYKKKNLKFLGKGSEVRAAEMNAARGSVRQQRFSLQRPLEDMDQQNANSLASKVPTLGIPKPQSRLDMLNKWKEEKELKKRLELNSKKPVFKVGPARYQLDTMVSSRLQALKASRIQPVSKLADITHQKNLSSRPDTKAIVKPVQTRSIPSSKPQIARLQVNEAKIAPSTKPQIGKQQTTKVNSSAPSNFKPQSNTGIKATKISNSLKPVAGKSAIIKEEKKIPTTRIRPPTLPPLRRPQNQQVAVTSVPSTKAVAKAVEKPLNRKPEVKNPTGSSLDQSSQLQSWPLSVIEDSAKEKSFAPDDFVFCAPKIAGRSSWLDDEGPCTILSRVMKEMNLKPRTSTPLKKELKKLQERENSFDQSDSTNTGECDDKKEYSSIPNADSRHIEALIDSSSSKPSELKNDVKAAFTFSIEDKVEDSKSVAVVVSSVENQGLDISSVNKEMGDLALSEKENRVLESEPTSSGEEKQVETSPEKEADYCVASEKDLVELCDESKEVKELSDVSSALVGPFSQTKDQNVLDGADISVFYPSEPAAVVPQKSKRFFSSCWKMEKPSLALISESPENFKELPQTPKSHRRKGLLTEEFTPRRSQRLARKSELKEENILEVKECFLDSPSVEAASRMSMRPYDFDRLHLEGSAAQGNSNGNQSTRSNRGKVSLLYTPPRLRASTRNKSLKGDLMTFSPNVE